MDSQTPPNPPARPFAVRVAPGKTYFWCRCGRSQRQPFCDGSHRDTGFEPVRYEAGRDHYVWFCGCKRTGSPPLCDRSHRDLAAKE